MRPMVNIRGNLTGMLPRVTDGVSTDLISKNFFSRSLLEPSFISIDPYTGFSAISEAFFSSCPQSIKKNFNPPVRLEKGSD